MSIVGKAKIIGEFDEEFDGDLPAFTVEVVSSNPNIEVKILEFSSFSIKFNIYNRSNDHQLVSGNVGDLKENLLVFGKTLHEGSSSKVSKTNSSDSSNTIEINSKWIQSKATAEQVANWIIQRIGSEKLEIDMNLVGTPVLEVGDIIKVYHHDIQMAGNKEFMISSVGLNWSDGLSTSIRAVEI